MVYAGTGATRGAGWLVVTATGRGNRAGSHCHAHRASRAAADPVAGTPGCARAEARRSRRRNHAAPRAGDAGPRCFLARGLSRGCLGRRRRGPGRPRRDRDDRARTRRTGNGTARRRRSRARCHRDHRRGNGDLRRQDRHPHREPTPGREGRACGGSGADGAAASGARPCGREARPRGSGIGRGGAEPTGYPMHAGCCGPFRSTQSESAPASSSRTLPLRVGSSKVHRKPCSGCALTRIRRWNGSRRPGPSEGLRVLALAHRVLPSDAGGRRRARERARASRPRRTGRSAPTGGL